MLNLSPPNISHILELPHEILQKIATDPSLALSNRSAMRASCKKLRDVVDTIDTPELSNNAHRISSDNGQQIFYLIEGRVFACGINTHGQLGLGTQSAAITTPTLIPCFQGQTIRKITSSGSHTFFHLADGRVFACGANTHGQLGLGHNNPVTTPTPIDSTLFQGQAIREITSHEYHTFFQLEDGRVFACGANSEGELGLGFDTQGAPVTTPTPIDSSLFQEQTIREITSYGYYTFFHLADDIVCGCGANTFGQLGLDTQGVRVTTPTPINSTPFRRQTIRKITSNSWGNFFHLANDLVFACGFNQNGQLGFDSQNIVVATPTLINPPCFQGQTIRQITINTSGVFFHLANGHVFARGENQYGQLGLGHNNPVTTPTLINSHYFQGQTIRTITSGSTHTFFQLTDGCVFACGNNTNARLGLGHNDPVTTPTLINLPCFQGQTIRKITKNRWHTWSTFFHLTDDRVFACGANKNDGQLEFDIQPATIPVLIASTHPLWAVMTAKQQLLDQIEALKDLTSIPEPEVLNQRLLAILSHVSVQKTPEAILNALEMIREACGITTEELPELPDQALDTEESTGKRIPNPLIFSGLNKTVEIIQARSSQARPKVL